MKKLVLISATFVFLFSAAAASAQQFDAAVGVSTTKSASATVNNGLLFPSDGGGAYPGFSADFLFHRRFGIEGEINWRASQASYGGNQPYRPIFYAFNAIYAPHIAKNITLELMGGIGGEDIRFYNIVNCSNFFGCTNFASSNHFMGDFGGGIRAYVWHDLFIRPEARVYLINNNNEFSSGTVGRFGVSIGYSFGGR